MTRLLLTGTAAPQHQKRYSPSARSAPDQAKQPWCGTTAPPSAMEGEMAEGVEKIYGGRKYVIGPTMTYEDAKAHFDYDPESGVLTWKIAPAWRIKAGEVAGNIKRDKEPYYRALNFKGRRYLVHRVIWLLVHGEWPDYIDHANGDTLDNRLANLRNCGQRENQQNREVRTTGKLTGAHYSKSLRKWTSAIRANGRINRLGTFDTKEEAHAAYLAAKRELHTFNPIPRNLVGAAR